MRLLRVYIWCGMLTISAHVYSATKQLTCSVDGDNASFTYALDTINHTACLVGLEELDLAVSHSTELIVPETIVHQNIIYTITSVNIERNFFFNGYITKITFPKTLKHIVNCAFFEYLKEISVPEGVITIGAEAFIGCRNVHVVIIPESLREIGFDAFRDCDITHVVWNARHCETRQFRHVELVKQIDDISLYTACLDDCFNFIRRNGCICDVSADIAIQSVFPSTNFSSIIFGNHVEYIPCALCKNSQIKSVILPQSVRTIGQYAFEGCKHLKQIFIPANVDTIADFAFRYCNNLCAVSMEEGLRFVGSQAFSFTGIKAISLSLSLSYLGSAAFANTKIKEITIPEKLELIGAAAFEDCSRLKHGRWNATHCLNITHIPFEWLDGLFDEAPLEYISPFHMCKNIQSVSFGDNVEYIPTSFAGYESLYKVNKIVLPLNLIELDSAAFAHASWKVKSIEFPAGLRKIGKNAFEGNKSLRQVVTQNSVISEADMQNWFNGCEKLDVKKE